MQMLENFKTILKSTLISKRWVKRINSVQICLIEEYIKFAVCSGEFGGGLQITPSPSRIFVTLPTHFRVGVFFFVEKDKMRK